MFALLGVIKGHKKIIEFLFVCLTVFLPAAYLFIFAEFISLSSGIFSQLSKIVLLVTMWDTLKTRVLLNGLIKKDHLQTLDTESWVYCTILFFTAWIMENLTVSYAFQQCLPSHNPAPNHNNDIPFCPQLIRNHSTNTQLLLLIDSAKPKKHVFYFLVAKCDPKHHNIS